MTQLPEGWADAILQEICDVNPRHPTNTDRGQMVSFVPMPSVSDILGVIQDHEPRPLNEIWKGYTHFRDGDVIFAKITPCMENGKIAVASNLHNGLACGSTEFHVLRPYDGISARLIWYFLRRKSFRREAERFMTGAVGQRRVPAQYLQETVYGVPPTSEQHRIVAKLDALFARTRQAREELEHIPALIERYKQAILAAAFRGDLTADWRRESGLADNDWTMTSVGDVITDIRYGTAKKCGYEPNGTPVLRIPNITENGIDTTDLKYTELTEAEVAKLALKAGDVLVVRSNGSVDLVGRGALVDEAIEGFAYAGYLIRLRIDDEKVVPRFLRWMLSAPQTRRTIEVNARSTSGVHNINSEELQALAMPCISKEEQAEAVRRIEEAFEWLDIVLNEATAALRLLDHLDEAALAKAFRGELVPQDPNDEPASVLLERIREARAEQSNGGKRRKKE